MILVGKTPYINPTFHAIHFQHIKSHGYISTMMGSSFPKQLERVAFYMTPWHFKPCLASLSANQQVPRLVKFINLHGLLAEGRRLKSFRGNQKGPLFFWLVVSTHSKEISQIESSPQVRLKIKNVWNWLPSFILGPFFVFKASSLGQHVPEKLLSNIWDPQKSSSSGVFLLFLGPNVFIVRQKSAAMAPPLCPLWFPDKVEVLKSFSRSTNS